MSTYTYVHVFPILDQERPFRALVAEACRSLDAMAHLAGAHIIGEPHWSISDDFNLICRAPARPLNPEGEEEPIVLPGTCLIPEDKVERIQSMARSGYSINAIACRVGVKWKTAARYARMVRVA